MARCKMKNKINLANQEHIDLLMWVFTWSLFKKARNDRKTKDIKVEDIKEIENKINVGIKKFNLDKEEVIEMGKNFLNLKIEI